MKIISHRGNLEGLNPAIENHPVQIQKCIDLGYDVEIDLRMKDGVPHLGHDEAQYCVTQDWVEKRKDFLWIHAKEHDALVWLINHVPESKYFCHQSDDFTVVNKGFIWLHNLDNSMNEKCIIPLLGMNDILNFLEKKNASKPGFICTDFVLSLKKLYPITEDKND